MSDETKPRYFRLLEKGETIQAEDYYYSPVFKGLQTTSYVGEKVSETLGTDYTYFRPIQVDEWVSYAERKPTKEDKDKNGEVQYFTERGLSFCQNYDDGRYGLITHWRRITPPTPAKPKSVDIRVRTENGVCRNPGSWILTPLPDGSAKVGCGDIVEADSIEEFIKTRNEVMSK